MRVFRVVVVIALALTIALGVATAPVQAQPAVNTYTGPHEGSWKNNANWSQTHWPTSEEHAVIPTREGGPNRCVIAGGVTDAVAEIVTIQDGAELWMARDVELEEPRGSKLVVLDKVTVKDGGAFRIERESHLFVTNQITVESGGLFKLKKAYQERHQNTVEAKWVVIEPNGVIFSREWGILTVGETGVERTSTIDGMLKLGLPGEGYGGILKIKGSHTMEGSGGTIWLNHVESTIEPDGDPSDELTLSNDCPGSVPSPGCSLLMHGAGEVKVTLVNNAIVRADLAWDPISLAPRPMRLQVNCKEGSGIWEAQEEGELWVEVEVTGSALWRISNFPFACSYCGIPPCDCNPPKIVFTTCSDQLTGRVELLTGWFQAGTVASGASFCTEGNLEGRSTSSATDPVPDDPRIVVCPNQEVRFGGSCLSFCQ